MYISVTNCSLKKAIPPKLLMNGIRSKQKHVNEKWVSIINSAQPEITAENLYTGRGFKALLSETHDQPLYIVSAGLGLISSNQKVPSYDCTISPGYNSSLGNYIDEKLDLNLWWKEINKSKYSVGNFKNIGQNCDVMLISLTKQYLNMVFDDLNSTNFKKIIFSAPSVNLFDADAKVTLSPYTEAFDGPDGLFRGTKYDFAQRCHADFINRIHSQGSVDKALNSVSVDMEHWSLPKKNINKKIDDEELLQKINIYKDKFTSMNPMLIFFRRELRIACEKKRFSHFFKIAQE